MVNEEVKAPERIWPWSNESWHIAQAARWQALVDAGWKFEPAVPRYNCVGMEMTFINRQGWPTESHSFWIDRDDKTPEEIHGEILVLCERSAIRAYPVDVEELAEKAAHMIVYSSEFQDVATVPSTVVESGEAPTVELSADRNAPCASCGGPHDFDTSVPSAVWNRVIRAKGLPEYLCTTCIVREFVRAGEGFTAQLWNEEFYGVPIEVIVNGQNANDAALVSDENTAYRVRIEELENIIISLDDVIAGRTVPLEEIRQLLNGSIQAIESSEASYNPDRGTIAGSEPDPTTSPAWRAGVEAGADRAFKSVLAVEGSDNHYSALQKAASVAASVRALIPAGVQEDGNQPGE